MELRYVRRVSAMSALGVVLAMLVELGLMPRSSTGLNPRRLDFMSRNNIDQEWLMDLCEEFVHIPYSMSNPGEILIADPDASSSEECCQACLDVEDFVCTAALVQYPSICFITGYRLRNVGRSVHYSRTCESGSSCYAGIEDMSAGFSDIVSVPATYRTSNQKANYCINVCSRTPNCMAFDMYDTDCAFFHTNMTFNVSNFATYLRRCWPDPISEL